MRAPTSRGNQLAKQHGTNGCACFWRSRTQRSPSSSEAVYTFHSMQFPETANRNLQPYLQGRSSRRQREGQRSVTSSDAAGRYTPGVVRASCLIRLMRYKLAFSSNLRAGGTMLASPLLSGQADAEIETNKSVISVRGLSAFQRAAQRNFIAVCYHTCRLSCLFCASCSCQHVASTCALPCEVHMMFTEPTLCFVTAKSRKGAQKGFETRRCPDCASLGAT